MKRYTTLLRKANDPISFIILVALGNLYVHNGLLDLGDSINIIPFSLMKKIG